MKNILLLICILFVACVDNTTLSEPKLRFLKMVSTDDNQKLLRKNGIVQILFELDNCTKYTILIPIFEQ